MSSAHLHKMAFEKSLQPNIIFIAKGNIIKANRAACKLLGYSKKEILTKTWAAIFKVTDSKLKKIWSRNKAAGFVTVIKNNGVRLACEVTFAIFIDENGYKKAIMTISNISKRLLSQKNIDIKKAKTVADNIVLAKSKQRKIDINKAKVVAHNIVLVTSKQRKIDVIREEIAAIKEKIVDDNILIVKTKQIGIDRKREEIVADNITIAQAKSDARQAKYNESVRTLGETRNNERLELGNYLNENVNQLLCSSRLYLNMVKGGGENTKTYLNKSTKYTTMAIKEVRKLTLFLTTDTNKFF